MVVGHGGTADCLRQYLLNRIQCETDRTHTHCCTVTPADVRPGIVTEVAAEENIIIGFTELAQPCMQAGRQ